MNGIRLSSIGRTEYLITRSERAPSLPGAPESEASRGAAYAPVGRVRAHNQLRAQLLAHPRELARFMGLTAPSSQQLEQAAERIVAELARGPLSRYQLWQRIDAPKQLDDVRLDAPPESEPPPQPAEPEHWIELEVLTAKELPAEDIAFELVLPDGEQRSGQTDGDGRVRIDGIAESGTCKLAFPDIDVQAPVPHAPGPSEREAIAYLRERLSLPVDRLHTIRLPPERMMAHYVEFDDVFFSFNSTALLPETKDHTPPNNADGEPITGIGLCVAVLQYTEQFDGQKSLLLLGHTDTVGSDDDNVTLAQLRAQVVYGLVAGDRQVFMDAVDAPHVKDKQQKAKVLFADKNFVLDWVAHETGWPCSLAENYNDHWTATKRLQESYNDHRDQVGGEATLTVDRDFGKQTWGAVFDVYQAHIARVLEIDRTELRARQAKIAWTAPQTKHAGCGEFHPLDLIGRDGVRSATNRRAEAVFFDPGEAPALECFAGGCAQRQCELFQRHLVERKPLPPSWKGLWKVGWDRATEPAKMGEVRDIILTAPKLADELPVTFEITMEVSGQRKLVATLEALSANQGARVSFGAWYQPDAVIGAGRVLALDEPFPVVRFHVKATADEREVEGRRALIYADTLEAEVQHTLVRAETAADRVAPAECLINSPWGCKRAEIDELGMLIVPGLPPGGVFVTIDDDPYYPE